MVSLIKSYDAIGFSADEENDPLEKALKAPHKVNYGAWKGLHIIAIGPKGGKIVGYTSKHEPIYAGTPKASKLAALKMDKDAAVKTKSNPSLKNKLVTDWLLDLGIKAVPYLLSKLMIGNADALKLHQAFGTKTPPSEHGTTLLHYADLFGHVGQALKPAEHHDLDYGATMASGDADHPAFPADLSTLTEIPAGQFAGSHGNKLFKDANGRRFIFKAENPTIARAEEAVSRLGRLILGPGKVQDAKYVQLGGQDGVLIAVIEGATPLGPEHKTIAPKTADMQKHFEDIVGQHVLDWIVSNHDAHGDNFQVTKEGVVGIDKGQAWKWIGKDKLSPDYNPNPSSQVYSFFWNQVKAGKISGDPLPVLQKVFANVEKITEEQFKAIVAPYVSLRAGKDGVTAASVEKKLLNRFKESKSNWEWFLGQIYNKGGLAIPIIPNADAGPAKLKIEAPAAELVVPAKKTDPVVANKPAGWPIQKGTVKVYHPGTPALAGWPKGYPGPGYAAEIDYKGQKFELSFTTNLDGGMLVSVDYPDGKHGQFDSPNKACDSLYLWSKGLPLNMSAAEKKKQGISYSATKMLNLKAFEKEFSEHGQVKSSVTSSVEELEATKQAAASTKKITPYDAVHLQGPGLVLETSILPPNVKDWAELNKQDIFAEISDAGFGIYTNLWASKLVNGVPKYYGWALLPSGATGNLDIHHELPKALQGTKWDLTPKAPAEIKPKVVDVLSVLTAPDPVPPTSGTKITVKKKGIADPVTLEVLSNGQFKTTVNGESVTFNSLSAASDHVWVVSQGFKNVAHYQKETGKKKIASGGGWKFWGVKPGQEPKAPQTPAQGAAASPPPAPAQPESTPTPAPVEQAAPSASPAVLLDPSDPNWETMPPKGDPDWWWDQEPGTEVKFLNAAGTIIKYGEWTSTKESGTGWKTVNDNDDVEVAFYENSGEVGANAFEHSFIQILKPKGPSVGWKPSAQEMLDYPQGTVISFTSKDAQGGPLEWILVKQHGDDWKVTLKLTGTQPPQTFNWASAGASASLSFSLAASEVKVDLPGLAQPAKIKKTVHYSIAGLVQDSTKLQKIEQTANTWSITKTDDGKHFLGEKLSGWAAWVPPPGAWIEGEYDGQKYWFTTAVSGWSPGGDTNGMVNFALANEKGEVFYDSKPVPGDKANEKLFDLLDKHIPDFSGIDISDVFAGFEKNTFLPGVTSQGINYDAVHASDHQQKGPAPSPGLTETHPADLKEPEASKPTTIELNLSEAWNDLPEVKKYPKGKFKFKPGLSPGTTLIALDAQPWIPNEQLAQELMDFILKYGISTKGMAKTNTFGAFIVVPSAFLATTKVKVEVPASKVPPLELAQEKLEPMSEEIDPITLAEEIKKHPKKIPKSWKNTKKLDALLSLPTGTKLTLGSGAIFTKLEGGFWKGDDAFGEISPNSMAYKIGSFEGAAVSLGKEIKIPKKKTEVLIPTWTPPPKDPKAEAKKAWSKDHPSLTPEQTKHLSWWLQKKGLSGTELFARQTKAGNLVIGDGTDAFAKHIGSVVGVPLQTPHGTLYAVSWKELKDSTPEATTIKGPDGADYPHGTTFETEFIPQPFEEMVKQEQGFTKFSEYKGPEPKKFQHTIKIAGNTVAHKMMAEAIVKKYNLDTPIIQGSGNTMIFASTETMKKAVAHEQKVTPKIPKQPDPPKLKSVGASLGVPNEGQPAPINRDDLSAVDSIIPFRHGYSIRFGAGGVLMDGQLRMHRIRLPSGQVVHRFVGELTKDAPPLDHGKHFHFYSASSVKKDPIFGGAWKEHDYDPQTGIVTMSDHSNWKSAEGSTSGAELANGSMVYTLANYKEGNKTQRRMFVVDVPVGQDTEQALSQAMTKMGVDPKDSMAHPDEQDDRILIKTQALKSFVGPNGYNVVSSLGLLHMTKDQREQKLDAMLKGKIAKKHIDSARIVVGHDGFHHVEMNDIDDKIGTEAKAVITGISVEGIARAVLQGGYAGQSQCLLNGNSRNLDASGSTASGSSDMAKGGGVGRFFSMINSATDNVSAVGSGKPKLIVHPRVLRKTNWYAAGSDTYGAQMAHGTAKSRNSALSMKASSGEVMIENVSAADFAGALVETQHEKTALLGYFQKMGISEINGCPVDQFVVVGSVTAKISSSIKKMPLLKEG